LDEYTAARLQRLLLVQSQPWFRRRLSSRTRREITGAAEDNRAIVGGSTVTEVSRAITAEARRGVIGATMKQARSLTCY
jgi:hypothetical protein